MNEGILLQTRADRSLDGAKMFIGSLVEQCHTAAIGQTRI